ncbi:hypothetical protein BDP27DRAFT_1323992 [Rhodocollybia butyracea]|uniref:Uncharacterized protein n=1 Tax=Rhodocollybia butyracea TaxID=206335 RepID=A0A9P5PYK7_9AGAR|nr:hypothetical protein BDP27DRAFT_1323992 [Rhodocollybia butyracea]
MRRGPPSPLRLAQGPTPARSVPKFYMPSVPRPTFAPPMVASRGPRQRVSGLQVDTAIEEISSPVSAGSSRGPWDHTRLFSIPVSFDLTPLKRAIVV